MNKGTYQSKPITVIAEFYMPRRDGSLPEGVKLVEGFPYLSDGHSLIPIRIGEWIVYKPDRRITTMTDAQFQRSYFRLEMQ